jgi:hypothetical protein
MRYCYLIVKGCGLNRLDINLLIKRKTGSNITSCLYIPKRPQDAGFRVISARLILAETSILSTYIGQLNMLVKITLNPDIIGVNYTGNIGLFVNKLITRRCITIKH